MDKEFGARLRKIRKSRKVAMKELALLADKSEGWVSRLETGQIDEEPSFSAIVKWSALLGVSTQELTGIQVDDLPIPAASDHTRQMAEIGERVVSMVEQRRNIVPGPQIRIAPALRIPVVNNLSASQLASDIRQVETFIEVPVSMLNGATDPVAFIVVGDCLHTHWDIRTGDTLIVDAANKDPRDGQIVAALIDDQDRTAKEFYRVPGGVDLRPTSPGYDTIQIRGETQLTIIGVYVNHLNTGKRGRR